MARGRLLNKSISQSKKVWDLPDYACRLLATWIIAHLDMNGVFHADPSMVRSLVFTRDKEITVEMVQGYLDAMEEVGLMYRFEAKGDVWQCWPGFDENQPNLRKERETTDFPPPPDDRSAGNARELGGSDDGESPAQINLSEVKGREGGIEGKGTEFPPAVDIMQELCGQRPKRALWAEIEQVVGDELGLWRDVVMGWLERGYNPGNIRGMLDWFEAGGVPPPKNGGHANQDFDRQDGEAYREAVERWGISH